VEYSSLGIDMKKTGQKTAKECRQQGITIKDLQTLFGFAAPNAIYRWLRGETLPTVDHLVILAHALKVPVDELLVLKEKEPEH
jgi:transcriptional regulator with XRE-family HTH domain